jgi:hypothetical protein
MKWIPLVLIIITSIQLNAQRVVSKNLPNFDRNKWIHFGAYFGTNQLSFKIQHASNFGTLDSIYVFEVNSRPGFNLGIVSDLHLGDGLDLRCLPTLSFGQRDLEYTVFDKSNQLFTETRQVESTFASLPLLFKYKSARINNARVYLLGGMKMTYDFASNKNVDPKDKSVVRLRKSDWGYEFGFGIDFYLEFFKFAPEIRVYHGIRDILIDDSTFFTTSVDKVFSRAIMFSLTFEG